jgi:hypothetical protein
MRKDRLRKDERLRRKLSLPFFRILMRFGFVIGGFRTFADFFFDGIIADWLVQSKIQEARRQVEDAINQVEWILGSLRSMQ